ncbi:MAG: putative inorganic carbon transporter subunit DabA, partial [Cyclobacteriaceae bacterium]
TKKSFQALLCIDDRECSFRRYIEDFDHESETFGTPGFFSVEFYYQPEGGKFYTKLCPAPVTPKYLIKGIGQEKRQKDAYLSKTSHSFYGGWLISQTLGFWSALLLFINIFKPSMGPATASSFRHMSKKSQLTIENKNPDDRENDLQIGFTIAEMANRVEALLKSIGLVKDFAPIIYVIGHGSSSVNNPHYAAYDCGACSGRAGSVNSRVVSFMGNHPKVRELLKTRGIDIPEATQFLGGLHDTTRDEIIFFDENSLSQKNLELHNKNEVTFAQALNANAKERSRRFESIDSHLTPEQIHDKILTRSVSLFEPRPELNHATNALCVVGRRELTKHLFMDRRSFMNSYDYRVDLDGKFLVNVLRPVGPVCGGINLEYFFSRVDNQKLGAGSKLAHSVMG